MKVYKKYIVVQVLILLTVALDAQTINWAAVKKENRSMININTGVDFGSAFGLGYAYQLKSKAIPVIVNAEYSFPAGKKKGDDFKTKIGGQIRWIKYNNFQFSTKLQGVFRRYGNDLVRLLDFGSDLSGTAGYYRSKWFIAGEAGFDKAIVTNAEHTQIYKDQYPGVADGWYEPATGGNFYYGVQAGYSSGKFDIYLKTGKMLTQDFKTTPLVPLYGQLGFNFKF